MKTVVLLLCCHGHSVTDWSPVINALPCICWGIIALVAFYLLMKYVASPLIVNCHELKVKKVNSNHEEKLATSKKVSETALEQKKKELEIERLKSFLSE